MTVTPVGDGLYRVDDGDRSWLVAIAGPAENRWIWIDGQVFVVNTARGPRARRSAGAADLSAPMPATVVKVLAAPGQRVSRGEVLVMLEAMKMELPVRAPRDGVVTAVHCTAGQLVQPGTPLLEMP